LSPRLRALIQQHDLHTVFGSGNGSFKPARARSHDGKLTSAPVELPVGEGPERRQIRQGRKAVGGPTPERHPLLDLGQAGAHGPHTLHDGQTIEARAHGTEHMPRLPALRVTADP
jgi:hypothetical protein